METTASTLVFFGLLMAGSVSSSPTSSASATAGAASVGPSSALNLWNHLPREWSSMCMVDYDVDHEVNATIKCRVTPRNQAQWRLADLRTSLASLVESQHLEVAVDLRCETGGNISLPFPMRAPGLVKLTVINCRLLDKYDDFGTPAATMRDWLRVQDLRDCVWVNDPADLDSLLMHLVNMTSHYECGQDSTIVSYIYRNISDNDLDLDQLGQDLLGGSDSGDPTQLLNNSLDALLAQAFNGSGSPGSGVLNSTNSTLATGSTFTQEALDSLTPKPGEATSEDLLNTMIGLDSIQTRCEYTNMEVLDESDNPLTNRNHFEFLVKNSQFPKLRLLNYSSIGMTEVPLELRESRRKFPQSKLGVIDLSHNYIQRLGVIPPYLSKGIPVTLILQYNNITEVSLDMFLEWAQVPDFYVDIRNNPIACSCDFKEMLTQFLNESKWAGPAMTYYRKHLSVMQCATPPALSRRTIGSLSVDDLPCPVAGADLRPAMAALVVIVVILLVLLVLAVKYRKEVRILMYTRVNIVLPCGVPHQLPADAPEKVYDAFVSYAHQDCDWVLESLLKRLEEPSNALRPVKLCIHQRDFVVGKPIIDNIIDSITSSRHTIIVLSKNFVQSKWAMEELKQAYQQSLEERRRHLVLVVLEDVAQSDMEPVLRRCCKTFTYLHVNDSLFWDRLLYSLHIDLNNTNKSKEARAQSTSSAEYDNVTIADGKKGDNYDVEKGKTADDTAVDDEFNRAVFSESMRSMSIDSTSSTTTEPITPSQVKFDRPLFMTRA